MLELYHNNLSVCAQKVRIVLAEENVPWTSRYARHLFEPFTRLP